MSLNLAEKYIDDVMNDRIVIGSIAKMAVERHVLDLENGKDRGIYFDKDWGKKILKFVKLHRHTGGKLYKKFFDMQPSQAFFFWSLFGWRLDNGDRRFIESYKSMARKGGKTEEAGIVGNACFLLENYGGCEFYTAATQRRQASVTYDVVKKQLKMLSEDFPDIADLLKFMQFRVIHKELGGFVEALPGDSEKLDALRPYVAIIDEYHAHKTSSLKEVISSGMGHAETPLIHTTTTAGYNKDGPCYRLRKVGIDILKGIKQDDRFFFIDYTLDEGDEWQDESVWEKSNPNLGKAPHKSFLQKEVKAAQNEGAAKEVAVKTKNFNVWTSTSISWIQDEDWKASGHDFDHREMIGRKCHLGIDLASTRDLTAACWFFPAVGKMEHRLIFKFWCPDEALRDRSRDDRVDYLQWKKDGILSVTPGNATDEDYLIRDILEESKKYKVIDAGCDPWNGLKVIAKLNDNGIKCYEYRQGYKSMTPPLKLIEKLILNKRLNHGNNPIMRWMMSNIALTVDPADNIKADKAKSGDKIDGVIAMAEAIGMWDREEIKTSIYETQGLTSLG